MKKVLSLLLAVMLLTGSLAVVPAAANAVEAEPDGFIAQDLEIAESSGQESEPEPGGEPEQSSIPPQSSKPAESSQPKPKQHTIVMRLNSVKALLDGAEIAVDPLNETVAPFTLDGKTMVPVRFVENLDAKVKYTGDTKPVTVTYGDITLTLEFGKDTMTKVVAKGQPETVKLPKAPSLVEGKTCVPIREVAEGLGFSVVYKAGSYVIVVSTSKLSSSKLSANVKSGMEKLPAFVAGVKSIKAKNPGRAVKVGGTVQLSKADIKFNPTKVGCDKLVYSSSNPDIVSVTSQGKLTGKAKGSARITIASHNGKKTVIAVTVLKNAADIRVYNDTQKVYAKVGTDLYANYKWTRDSITYVRRYGHPDTPKGYTREQMYAVQGLETKKGNCFVYAATFTALAKGLGYKATYIEGQVSAIGGGFLPHGFVLMEIDGAKYICDPQLEAKYPGRNLYMQPINNTQTTYILHP